LRREGQRFVKAVDDVSFQISRGEIFALAGESGCGKTTTGKLLSLLETPSSGSIIYEGEDLANMKGRRMKHCRRRIQMIFQDPYESLDPRFTVMRTLLEPLLVHNIGTHSERNELVSSILEKVGLRPPRDFLMRYPHELSGGQRQRIAVARAMILNPTFIVADEPVSMLDVSVRAGILNLMLQFREELGITYLFITHDLAVARYMSNKIVIMYLGRMVEMGSTDEVLAQPIHFYTKLLMSAVPTPDPSAGRVRIKGISEVADPVNIPSGCSFHPRCQGRQEICAQLIPEMVDVGKGHLVACHKA